MTPYVVVALVVVILPQTSRLLANHLAYARPREKTIENPRSRGISFFDLWAPLLLIAFAGLRSTQVGTDTPVYARSFSIVDPSSNWIQTIERMPYEDGYTILMLTVKYLGGSFTTLLFVMATLTVGAVYWGLRRQSKDIPLALGLYVLLAAYLSPMNIARQGLAVALVFLASTFIARRLTPRGFVTFTFLAFLAYSFHTSALLAAVAIFAFRGIRLTLWRAMWSLTLAVVIAGSLWVSDWLSGLIQILSPRYEVYLESGSEGGIGVYLILAVSLALLVYALGLRPAAEDLPWVSFVLLSCMATIMGTQSIYAARLASYFSIFLILLIPNVMRTAKIPAIHRVVLILLSSIYYFFYLENFGGLNPYQIIQLD